MANTRFIETAARACWDRPRGLRKCFLEVAQSHDLQVPLERTILIHDISNSDHVHEKFTDNLVIFVLNLSQVYEATDVLKFFNMSQDALLSFVMKQLRTGLHRTSFEEAQLTSLVRLLFMFSGGKADVEQHNLSTEFTANENANLFRDLLCINGSDFFRCFDAKSMLDALSKSKIPISYGLPNSGIVRLSSQMMDFLHVGYQKGHLNLPDKLLFTINNRSIDEISKYIEHFYRKQPSLRLPENNILLLFT